MHPTEVTYFKTFTQQVSVWVTLSFTKVILQYDTFALTQVQVLGTFYFTFYPVLKDKLEGYAQVGKPSEGFLIEYEPASSFCVWVNVQ